MEFNIIWAIFLAVIGLGLAIFAIKRDTYRAEKNNGEQEIAVKSSAGR